MDRNGIPVNAHPLTVREASRLAKVLTTSTKEKEPVLRPDGIVSEQILYFDTSMNKVIWYTKGMGRQMLFTEDLGIPNGTANVPPMLWVADRNNLAVLLWQVTVDQQKNKIVQCSFLMYMTTAMFVWVLLIRR